MITSCPQIGANVNVWPVFSRLVGRRPHDNDCQDLFNRMAPAPDLPVYNEASIYTVGVYLIRHGYFGRETLSVVQFLRVIDRDGMGQPQLVTHSS